MFSVLALQSDWVLRPSGAASSLGAGPVRTLATSLVVAGLAANRRWRAAGYVLAAAVTVHALDRGAKQLLSVPRPPDPNRGYALPGPVVLAFMAALLVATWVLLARRTATGLWMVPAVYVAAIGLDHLVRLLSVRAGTDSFPSGHASNTMALALAVVAVRPADSRWSRWCWAAVGAAVLVGISRVTLGFHRPTDVLAGWILAVITTTALQPLFGVRCSTGRVAPAHG